MNFKITPIDKNNIHLAKHADKYLIEKNLPTYATSFWQDILHGVYNLKTYRLCAIDENEQIIGHCLAYYDKHNRKLYTPRFGVCVDSSDIALAFYKALEEYCYKHDIFYALVTFGTEYPALETHTWTKTNMFLPLKYDCLDTLWTSLPKKTRNMVRKAEKNKLKVTHMKDAVETFYPIYEKHMVIKGLRVKPKEYFLKLEIESDNSLDYFAIRLNDEIVGFMVFLSFGNIVSYLYNVCDYSAAQLGANNMMMWEAMKYYHNGTKTYIELGESSEGGSVYNFKKRLSKDIEIVPIHYANIAQDTLPLSYRFTSIIKGKIYATIQRILPLVPHALKSWYLQIVDRRDRVI